MNGLPGPLSMLGTLTITESVLAALTGLLLLAVSAAVTRAGCRALRGALKPYKAEDLMTVLAASVATAVAMTGMWRVFGDALHFSGLLRVLLFTFLELATVTSAVRARRNIRESAQRVKAGSTEKVTAGADGLAVWVFTLISAVIASLGAGSILASLVRFAAPFVAAWLWERSLAAVRRQVLGGKTVHSKLTLERILVWLGIAESTGRTVSEVDTHRRLARLARAANHSRVLVATGAAGWRQRRAARRRLALLMAALEHTKLATDEDAQRILRQHIGWLAGSETLSTMDVPAPWGTAGAPPANGSPASLVPPAGSALVVPAALVPAKGSVKVPPPQGSGSAPEGSTQGSSGSGSGGSGSAPQGSAPEGSGSSSAARPGSGSRKMRTLDALVREAQEAEAAAGRHLGVKALRAALACNYQTARSVAKMLHPDTKSDDAEAVNQ